MNPAVTTDPLVGPAGERTAKLAMRFGIVGTALNLIGLALAVYLTYEHYSATANFFCPAGEFINCEKVTASSYATFLGVPVALAGLFYFVVSIPLFLPVAWRSQNPWITRARWAWVAIGMVSVFWLIYGELDLGAICLYCTGVHVVTFALLVLTAVGSVMLIDEFSDEFTDGDPEGHSEFVDP